MARKDFPANIYPTSRSYKPGKLPETVFTAANGATTFVQYGQQFVNAELQLEFANVVDGVATDILEHYESMQTDDYTIFDNERGFQGMLIQLQRTVESGNDVVRYRYAEPPTITSVYPGISTVSVRFIGYLYGV